MNDFKTFFENYKQKSIAVFPGGSKPPHKGHFKALEYLLQTCDEGVVFIGTQIRDGITAEMAKQIWDIYAKYLPVPVDVQISPVTPVKSVYEFTDANLDKRIVVGAGDKDDDINRYSYFMKNVQKYPFVEVVKIPIQEGGISGSATRQRIQSGDPQVVDYFVPDVVSPEDRNKIKQILGLNN
jgi:hypothetical protein